MTVSWKEPADDGKSTILGYVLEKKESKEMQWIKLNRKPIMERMLEVSGLSEGTEYDFRITALNLAGPGAPSEPSTSTYALDPISESIPFPFNSTNSTKLICPKDCRDHLYYKVTVRMNKF